jgi:hypothetical protein
MGLTNRFLVGAGAAATLAAAVWLGGNLERTPPSVSVPGGAGKVGKRTPYPIRVEDQGAGLRALKVVLLQGDRRKELHASAYPPRGFFGRGPRGEDVSLVLEPGALGLVQGEATLRVEARDYAVWGLAGNGTVLERTLMVDTLPPRLEVLSSQHHVSRGGTGVVAYQLGEVPGRTGVEVGTSFFPGYPEPGGGEGAFLCFFAVPHDAPPGAAVTLVATDVAGNETRSAVPIDFKEKVFRHDTIELGDDFLQRKIPEFRAADPSLPGDPVGAFLAVNRDWRARDHRTLQELTRSGSPTRLWSGPFLQMRNTKTMAGFADRRSYRRGGAVIDTQTHLGLDLASTAGAPVEAANAGLVVFAGDLGIYGQTVVLDHGQGLFSLYSHLSGIGVAVGDRMERGRPLGQSGQTGMAGGDHLHFATIISGVFVSPLEWLDDHWIRDNVLIRLAHFPGGRS